MSSATTMRRTFLAAAALLLILALMPFAGREAFVAYLIAWLFTLGICVGAMVTRMVHALTGGRWGDAIRPTLLALTAALPVVAALVVPLFFGLHLLFEWSRPEAVAASTLLQRKAGYLNVPFFVARTLAVLMLWSLLAWRLVALERACSDSREAYTRRLQATSIAGLILYAASVTVFGVDWVMSLVPQWHSTGFGLVFALGQMLAGFAAALAATAWASRGEAPRADAQTLNDLGNIALTLVLTWAYLAFMQYLVTWIGDQPQATAWYLPRVQSSWTAVGIALILAHFAAPFLVLLFRAAKRCALVAALLGAGLLAAHWIDALWLVAPGFRRGGFALHWTDFLATAALLAVLRTAMTARWAQTASAAGDGGREARHG